MRRSEPSYEENSGEKVAVPTNLRVPSQIDRIRTLIRQEQFRIQLASEEAETFEEADDFELDDGEKWVSPYEEVFEPEAPSDPPAPGPDSKSQVDPPAAPADGSESVQTPPA